MNKVIKIIADFLIMFCIMIALMIGFVIKHEDAHHEINKHHNVESEINYGFMYLNGMTTSYVNESTIIEPDIYYLAHDLNDIIGYHASVIVICLSTLCCIVLTKR